MKASRVALLLVLSFLLGGVSHWAYVQHRIEENRCGLEEALRKAFVRGGDFEKVTGWPKDGVDWTYNAQSHAYESRFPAIRDRWLHAVIQVDDEKKIQNATVAVGFRI
jgi:hypothetical protein